MVGTRNNNVQQNQSLSRGPYSPNPVSSKQSKTKEKQPNHRLHIIGGYNYLLIYFSQYPTTEPIKFSGQ